MEIDEAELIERETQAAAELLDRLLEAADGGRGVVVGQFGASTFLALLMNKQYRIKVMSRLDDFDPDDMV